MDKAKEGKEAEVLEKGIKMLRGWMLREGQRGGGKKTI